MLDPCRVFVVVLTLLCVVPSVQAQPTPGLEPELRALLDQQPGGASCLNPSVDPTRPIKRSPCWGTRRPVLFAQLEAAAFRYMFAEIAGFAGGGRLELVVPVGRRHSFHVAPGFTAGVGNASAPASSASGGLVDAVDTDLAFGLWAGPLFVSGGLNLGFARGFAFSSALIGPAGPNGFSVTFTAPVVNVAAVLSRRYPVRIGVRGGLFPDTKGSFYISFPFHRPFETVGRWPE